MAVLLVGVCGSMAVLLAVIAAKLNPQPRIPPG